jgi:DNA-binding transcriptional MerR regulator
MKTNASPQLTFSLNEAAEICLVRSRLLHRWIEEGRLVPAVSGSKGRGRTHRFSPQQLLGITVVAGLIWSKRGCSAEYGKEVMHHFGKMSAETLDHWLGLGEPAQRKSRIDERTEEAFAAWKQGTPILQNLGNPQLPGDAEALRDIMTRLERTERAIKETLSGQRISRFAIERNVLVFNRAKKQPKRK